MSRQYNDMVESIKSACCEENEIPGYEGYYATPDGEIANGEKVLKPHPKLKTTKLHNLMFNTLKYLQYLEAQEKGEL